MFIVAADVSLHGALPILVLIAVVGTSGSSSVEGRARQNMPRVGVTISLELQFQPPQSIAIPTLGIFCRARDRKSTRLNSSHMSISYAVFSLHKKNYFSAK